MSTSRVTASPLRPEAARSDAVLYYDLAHTGRGPGDGWRPCTAPGNVWTDPEQVLRFVCVTHRRQLTTLHAVGLADRIRWGRPGLPVGQATG